MRWGVCGAELTVCPGGGSGFGEDLTDFRGDGTPQLLCTQPAPTTLTAVPHLPYNDGRGQGKAAEENEGEATLEGWRGQKDDEEE